MGLALLALAAPAARPAQFHVPVHAAPQLWPQAAPPQSLLLAGGWLHARAPGLSLSGPGGGWELAGALGRRTSGHFQGRAFLLDGRLDPLGSGMRKTRGMTGTVEGDLAFETDEDLFVWRAYAGLLTAFTAVDIREPFSVTFADGRLRTEPDLATSVLLGVPLGLTARTDSSKGWTLEAAAHLVIYPAAKTFFSYSLAGPFGRGSSQTVDTHASAGGRLRAEYAPWRLGLQADGSVSSASGNNDTLTLIGAALTWRVF